MLEEDILFNMKCVLFVFIIYMCVTDDYLMNFDEERKSTNFDNQTFKYRQHRNHSDDEIHSRKHSGENHNSNKYSLTKCQIYLQKAKMKPLNETAREQLLAKYVVNDTEPPPYVQIHNDRYVFMAGEDGKVHLIDAEDASYMNEVITCFSKEVHYYLYTRKNPSNAQQLHCDVALLQNSYYDSSKRTVFLIHGWQGDHEVSSIKVLKHAFLANDDLNIIVSDWSKLSSTSYTTAKNGVHMVGKSVGEFIKWMITYKLISYEKLHLVGFSLGAHVAGNAGRYTGGRVQRITGLDPAGPLWYQDNNRLTLTDAQYVEVIHTNTHLFGLVSGWTLGYSEPCGHIDFYPNGGGLMPGCLLNSCSHFRAYQYMAVSLQYDKFKSRKCNDYWAVINNCCSGEIVLMGNNAPSKAGLGMYRVNTGESFPYYLETF